MGFAGELATIGLPEVFRNIAFNRLTGVLAVDNRSRQAWILFEEGLVRAFRSEPDSPFDYVTLALAGQRLPPEARRKAERRRRRRTLKEVLLDYESFDEARYDAAVGAAVREELIQLFTWTEAAFVFEEQRPQAGLFDQEQLDCDLHIDPQAIVVEAARRVDEWESISSRIASEREVFLPGPLPDGTELAPEAVEVIDLLDGTRDVAGIIEALPAGRFEVLRRLAELSDAGFIVRASGEQLQELAREAEERGEIHRAIGHLEAVVRLEEGNGEVRAELVRLYERAARRSDAAREMKRLAREREESGDLEGALESYARAVELAPYETEALERITEIHANRGDTEGYLRAGLQLAETLVSNRLLEDALDVYKRLVAVDEESVVLREALAATYIKLHEPKMAARELLRLAQQCWDAEDYDRALHYYRNVLAVDRDSETAARRIEEIEEGRLQEQRRGRLRRVLLIGGTLLVTLGLWQASREWAARSALHEAARATMGGMAHRKPDESLIDAVAMYADICRDYPFTRGAREAEESVRNLLLDELHRIRYAVEHDPRMAERFLQLLGRIRLPSSLQDFWMESRDQMLEALAERQASAPAVRD